MAKPVVAVVGRPNVGKSTLFNKLTGRRISIVEDTPGVTRDRICADCEWNGRTFTLMDTGGIEPRTDDVILSQMKAQAETAIDMACLLYTSAPVERPVPPVEANHHTVPAVQNRGPVIPLRLVERHLAERLHNPPDLLPSGAHHRPAVADKLDPAYLIGTEIDNPPRQLLRRLRRFCPYAEAHPAEHARRQ